MSTLLIKNIRTLVSCDSADTVYENVDLYAENGFIKEIGVKLDRKADKTIDASHMLCYPGLVNTHQDVYKRQPREQGRLRHPLPSGADGQRHQVNRQQAIHKR